MRISEILSFVTCNYSIFSKIPKEGGWSYLDLDAEWANKEYVLSALVKSGAVWCTDMYNMVRSGGG